MANSLDQRFGLVLRLLRERAGKTQEDFAEIGRTYLSELERGLKTPTLETIVKLSGELGVSPANLVDMATSEATTQGVSHSLPAILAEGAALATLHKGRDTSVTITEETAVSRVQEIVNAAGIDLPQFLAESALVAFRKAEGKNPRAVRQKIRYMVADKRSASALQYAQDDKTAWSLTPAVACKAMVQANITLELADDVLGMNGIPFYELLGTRNLGSFVGAIFAYSLQREMPDRLMVNGHQDGYPDLCALTAEGQRYIRQLQTDGMETAKKS